MFSKRPCIMAPVCNQCSDETIVLLPRIAVILLVNIVAKLLQERPYITALQ